MPTFARLELEPRPLLRAALATVALCGLIALGNGGGRWLDRAISTSDDAAVVAFRDRAAREVGRGRMIRRRLSDLDREAGGPEN